MTEAEREALRVLCMVVNDLCHGSREDLLEAIRGLERDEDERVWERVQREDEEVGG